MSRIISGGIALALTTIMGAEARAQTATTAGAIVTPHPTTQAIAVDWAITGDSNNNGVVAVRYRPAGTASWLNGMPLLRIPAGQNTTGDFGSGNGQWSNRHSGSLFDLAPGTSYEIELALTDPDGGSITQTATASTRPIPAVPAGAKTKNVTPTSIAAALAAAQPGDLLLLGAGTYGAIELTKSGNATSPIVLRGEAVDAVTIRGRVTLSDLAYVFLENVTVQGEVRMHGSSNMVVRGCRIQSTTNGIDFEIGDSVPRNNYVVDNDVVGGATWTNDQLGADGYNGGEGIQFTGSGHVICNNHVKGFRDNISLMEYDEAYEQISIDICNNDIEEATDDAIEADSAMGNVRVVRNRIKNCFDGASSQPNLGGPTYYLRNVMYNVLYSPFKFHNGTVGDVVMHNSVVKNGDAFGCYAGETWSRALLRNNLFIGGPGGTYGGYENGSGRVLQLADADSSCSFDYDGLGSIGTNSFSGRIGSTRFDSLATLKANTTEQHATQVDLAVFASSIAFPSDPFPPKPNVDLRLSAASAAADKGLAITGINDGFVGAAPDLGAYELGAEVPQYGPRSNGNAASGGTANVAGAPGISSSGLGGNVNAAGGTANVAGAPGISSSGLGGNVNAAGRASLGGVANVAAGSTSVAVVAGRPSTGDVANTAGAVTPIAATGGTSSIVAGNAAVAASPSAAGNPMAGNAKGDSSDGCGCRVASRDPGPPWILLSMLALMVRRRRDGSS